MNHDMNHDDAIGVGVKVVQEDGRWTVYLGVDFWDATAEDNPVETVWHRIADYPTAEAAHTAARWYQRGADRGNPELRRKGRGGGTD
jgi:hypothetical protein